MLEMTTKNHGYPEKILTKNKMTKKSKEMTSLTNSLTGG